MDDGDDTLITDVSVVLVVDIGISARGWWLAWSSGCGGGEAGIVSAVVLSGEKGGGWGCMVSTRRGVDGREASSF